MFALLAFPGLLPTSDLGELKVIPFVREDNIWRSAKSKAEALWGNSLPSDLGLLEIS